MIDFNQVTGSGSFYFVRHGESVGNVARIPQGRVDFPLTPEGRRQAKQIGRWFVDKEVDVVLSSPLLRASQTAEIVTGEIGIQAVQIWEELNEIEIGIFSGLTWEEIGSCYPNELRSFRQQSWDGVPGAEKTDELYARAGAVWALVLDLFQGGQRNIVVVTHSGLLQWIIKVTLGHKRWLPLFPMRNCSVHKFILNNKVIPPDEMVAGETPAYYSAWEMMGVQV